MAKTTKSKTPERARKPIHEEFVEKEKPHLVAKSQERTPVEQAARVQKVRIEKKATETTEEFDKRKEFYSLSNKKAPKNVFKQHKISKK